MRGQYLMRIIVLIHPIFHIKGMELVTEELGEFFFVGLGHQNLVRGKVL